MLENGKAYFLIRVMHPLVSHTEPGRLLMVCLDISSTWKKWRCSESNVMYKCAKYPARANARAGGTSVSGRTCNCGAMAFSADRERERDIDVKDS